MADFTPLYLKDYQPFSFSISTVSLTFELVDKATLVTNELSIKKTNSSAQSIILNGEQLTLVAIKLNDQLLTKEHYQLSETQLEIFTDETEFTLVITTEINPEDNSSLEGLYKSAGAFCTQCEAEGFRRISYFPDRPDVMAIYTTKIIADKKAYPYLLSNGNKVDFGDLADNKHFVTWQDPFPKPCYLFALVAGDFDLLSDSFTTCSDREVQLEIFVDKGNKHKATHAMASLKRSMLWDEETFGLEYDLDIYMIVAVDFFNMGAMENKGLNVFNSKFVLADHQCATDVDYFNIEAVIGHEYFHNWTGNRVTCRDWFQLSLKEGLTVFRDQQFSADMHSSAVTRIQNVRVLRSMQFLEDAGPMAHPIRPEKVIEMNNFYTLTVYEKGAEVIRMLHTLLGKSGFRKGMDLYFQRYDGMAVTCDDFVNAMADATQTDLTIFKHWYSQSGTPILTIEEKFDADKNVYALTIKQSTPKTEKQPSPKVLHIPIKIELIAPASSLESEVQSHLLELKTAEQTWTFDQYSQKPVLALLADFSAPVKLDFNQDDQMLALIMTQAKDSFCRWDAGQKLLMHYLHKLTFDAQFILPEQLISSFRQILTSNGDHAFIAEQLILPSFDEIVDSITSDVENTETGADPLAIVNAIKVLILFLAKGLEDEFLHQYQGCNKASSSNRSEAQQVADRALKNVCLAFLLVLPQHQNLAEQQFEQAFEHDENMTDTLATLTCSGQQNLPCFDAQMKKFESKWQSTTLVMDKWFSIAAMSSGDIFTRLETLQKHPLFSLKNPNRARSLISAFSMKNPEFFHDCSGQGYRFLAKQISVLNELNPQIASRLITPLIQFKSFAQPHQQLMKNELVILQGIKNLSKDLKEKLDAAIG